MKLLPLILFLPLISCEVLPTAKLADGSIITGGGTIFAKSQSKSVTVTHPNGLAMTYSSTGHDETVVPTKVIASKTTLGLAGYARDAFRTSEGTKRVLSGHDVEKTGIQSTERVELKKLDIPEEAPLEVAPAITSAAQ